MILTCQIWLSYFLLKIEKFRKILNIEELNLVAVLSGYLAFTYGASSWKDKTLERGGMTDQDIA
jgi:hypothetical protein